MTTDLPALADPWLLALTERAQARGERMHHVTPKLTVPTSLFHDWFLGLRPLPGQDERRFFDEVARRYGHERTAELQRRHVRLRAEEMGAAPSCAVCAGQPPAGFICGTCGAGGAA